MNISSQGKIYFQCPVVNRTTDPTGDVVAIAFLEPGATPVTGTSWNSGSWASSSTAPTYLAQVLVGLSPAVVLALGSYDAWVRITDSPEAPVLGPYPVTIV